MRAMVCSTSIYTTQDMLNGIVQKKQEIRSGVKKKNLESAISFVRAQPKCAWQPQRGTNLVLSAVNNCFCYNLKLMPFGGDFNGKGACSTELSGMSY